MSEYESWLGSYVVGCFAVRIPNGPEACAKLVSDIAKELGVWDLSDLGTGIFCDYELWIKTPNAAYRGAPGDWIIRDDRLGYSICTDEVFRAMRNSEQGLWSLYEPKTEVE